MKDAKKEISRERARQIDMGEISVVCVSRVRYPKNRATLTLRPFMLDRKAEARGL